MDALDRDLLYLRAKYDSLEELRSKYPGISTEKLQKLKAAIANINPERQ